MPASLRSDYTTPHHLAGGRFELEWPADFIRIHKIQEAVEAEQGYGWEEQGPGVGCIRAQQLKNQRQ